MFSLVSFASVFERFSEGASDEHPEDERLRLWPEESLDRSMTSTVSCRVTVRGLGVDLPNPGVENVGRVNLEAGLHQPEETGLSPART